MMLMGPSWEPATTAPGRTPTRRALEARAGRRPGGAGGRRSPRLCRWAPPAPPPPPAPEAPRRTPPATGWRGRPDLCPAVLEHVGHLLSPPVPVDRHRARPQRHGGHRRLEELDRVVQKQGNPVARTHTQPGEPTGRPQSAAEQLLVAAEPLAAANPRPILSVHEAQMLIVRAGPPNLDRMAEQLMPPYRTNGPHWSPAARPSPGDGPATSACCWRRATHCCSRSPTRPSEPVSASIPAFGPTRGPAA